MKKRRQIKAKPKRRAAPKVARGRRSSADGNDKKIALLTRERDEALAREAAAADVLRVISSSPGDLMPIFQSLLENATHICGAKFGVLWLREGNLFRAVAAHGGPTAYREMLFRTAIRPGPDTGLGMLLKTKRFVQIDDITKGKAYLDRDPLRVATVELAGGRTLAEVPLLKDGELIGSINIYHQEVKPFTEKQIELLISFAAQAVIAIENTRLLNELRQRTDDLSESLDRQTAMSRVLGIISSSPTDIEPVFQAIVESAARLCDAYDVVIWRPDGDLLYPMAHCGPIDVAPIPLNRGTPAGRSILDRQILHIADLQAEFDTFPGAKNARGWGLRALLCVPLMREGIAVGIIALRRREAQLFTDKQIELVTNFAAQAVIAIENTRLLNELRESLQQQTATADVLKVISSSPGELQAVFSAMLDNAVRTCEAKFGTFYLREDDGFRAVAMHNAPPAYAEARASVVRPHPDTSLWRAANTKQASQYVDATKSQGYIEGNPFVVAAVSLGGYRTVLSVPLIKDDELVGAISIFRQEVRPFTDKQIELLTNFAAQAVIAIENARLLNELRQRTDDLTESLDQQTATSEVLKVISSSPDDLEPVFQAMLENAMRICEAKFGIMFRVANGVFHLLSSLGLPPAFAEFQRKPRAWSPDTGLGRMLLAKQTVHVTDTHEGRAFAERDSGRMAAVEMGGIRSFVAVPMLKNNEVIGAFIVFRQEVRPFTDKQISLVSNFAAQAVIAIENTRLLNELRESLQQQTATADVLKVISRSTFDLPTVLSTLVESAARLCGADKAQILRPSNNEHSFYPAASYGFTPEYNEYLRTLTFAPGREGVVGRVLLERKPVQIADVLTDPDYRLLETQRLGGFRTHLGLPLLREGNPIGILVVSRVTVNPFDDKHIELLTTFADQAVIAIENVRLFDEVQAKTRDLSEALIYQTGSSNILKVIASSPTDVGPVLKAIVDSACELCDAYDAAVLLKDGDDLRFSAHHGPIPIGLERWPVNRNWTAGRAFLDQKPVHVHDLLSAEGADFPDGRELSRRMGHRSILSVPLLREGESVGVIVVRRSEVHPFSDKQIVLLQTFADQAVIAIENVRLFDDVQKRTQELSEALEQQAATSEVLNVISRSKFDLQPILQSVVDTAARLCRADTAVIFRLDQGTYRFAAGYCVDPRYMEIERRTPITPGPGTVVGRVAMRREVIRIVDAMDDPLYEKKEDAEIAQVRSMIGVPLMREGQPIGVIALARQRVEPFNDREIELVSTFADQAAIAIENVRLFESVESRTRELTKSLEDLRTAQDRLVQTEKLASLGQLTAGIAHEIKNPLNFVNNFSSLSVELIDELREALGGVHLDAKPRGEINELADMLQGNLEKVVQHGKRADSIVKNMLLHSRQGSGEHRQVDINALVEESLNLAYHGARAEKQGFNITLEKSFDPAAGEVDLFPQEITRVLLNLISNGFYAATKRKADANGGNYEPTLAASTKSLGDSVEIRIRDNGTGIPPEVKEKMFNPFFTTKPAGEGTGLGLSLSHDIIVKQHSGSIDVDTKPGEFTEFRIVLPRGAATIAKSGGRA